MILLKFISLYLMLSFYKVKSSVLSLFNKNPTKYILNQQSILVNDIKTEIISSPVLSFTPWLELHHIVVFKDLSLLGKSNSYNNINENDNEMGGIYSIDFSPINQTNPITLYKLLAGRYVPAEVRIRWIPENIYSVSNVKINIMCNNLNCFNPKAVDIPYSIDNFSINGKRSEMIEHIITKIQQNWGTSMNLYTHNCRHFSYYAKQIAYMELNNIIKLEGKE